MDKNMKLIRIGEGGMPSESLLQEKRAQFDQPVQIQVKLVSLGKTHPKDIENVTLTLGNLEEGWQVFESLTNLVWKEVGSSSKMTSRLR